MKSSVPDAPPCRGFTLVELAIVLIILALLSGGIMMTLASQIELRDRAQTQSLLKEASDALTGYAVSHLAGNGKPYLPCPDIDNDGRENRSANACVSQEGNLPWLDLGLAASDAWDNHLRYRVDPVFSNSATGFSTSSIAGLRVCEDASCTRELGAQLPAVVLAHGKNGLGATTTGGTVNSAPLSADELANTDNNTSFVSHPPTPSENGEFDDLLIWISPTVLLARMISAGVPVTP